MLTKLPLVALIGCMLLLPAFSQDAQAPPQSATGGTDTGAKPDAPAERWNLYYQATSIGQQHGTFNAPYQGPLSLRDDPEHVVSLTTTLFFGLNLGNNTQLYFDP